MSTGRVEQQLFAPQVGCIELAVIVPTYNAREKVYPLVQRLKQSLDRVNWELIIVDDDAPDGTADEVRLVSAFEPNIRVIQRIGRKGLASACVEGMLATNALFLAVMDTDSQYDESALPFRDNPLFAHWLRRHECFQHSAPKLSPYIVGCIGGQNENSSHQQKKLCTRGMFTCPDHNDAPVECTCQDE